MTPALCSPLFTAYTGAGAPASGSAIYQSCPTDAAGEATVIVVTDFADSDQNTNPVLSPDGTKILFTVLGASSGWDEVWVVNIDGSGLTQLVADGSNNIEWPAWGADSDTFVYTHYTGGSSTSAALMKDTVSAPGSPTTLKSAVANRVPCRPQFNFDGTRVAYIYDDTSSSAADLRCMDDDGTNDSSLDNTIIGYLFNDPPQFCWARTQNLIAYTDAQVAREAYVIADDGTGKTAISANGEGAGSAPNVAGHFMAWAPGDAFIVLSGDVALGDGIQPIRAEVDGSDTTVLGTGDGPENRNGFRGALVYNNRIWYILATNAVNAARIGSMALDGSDEVTNFNNTLGAGDMVSDFTGGDGWYFN